MTSNILKQFLVTEKAASLSSELNQYVFEVDKDCTRTQVAKAVEERFKVNVTHVNVLFRKGKLKQCRGRRNQQRRTNSSKRVIVSVKKGEAISLN